MLIKVIFWLSSVCLVYPYIIYPSLIRLLKFISPPPVFRVNDDELPPITVIIYALNNEKTINQRITNCFSLDYPAQKLEILVVSDGSTDRTNEIVKSYEGHGVRLLEIPRPRGRVHAMNEAVRFCATDIITFTDTKISYRQDSLRNLLEHMADKRIAAIGGNVIHMTGEGHSTEELDTFYWRFEADLNETEGARGFLMDLNIDFFAMKKELYSRIPYNVLSESQYLACDLIARGHLVYFEPKARAVNEVDPPVEHNFQKKAGLAAGNYQILAKFLKLLNVLDGGFGTIVFISHKFLRWMGPLFLLGLFVSNFLLALEGLIYYRVFLLQSTFYVCAILGLIFRRIGVEVMLLNICFDFIEINRSYLSGLFLWLFNTSVRKVHP